MHIVLPYFPSIPILPLIINILYFHTIMLLLLYSATLLLCAIFLFYHCLGVCQYLQYLQWLNSSLYS